MTMEKIKVVADFDWLENEETIGLLGHESQRGTDVYTFEYDKDWLIKSRKGAAIFSWGSI